MKATLFILGLILQAAAIIFPIAVLYCIYNNIGVYGSDNLSKWPLVLLNFTVAGLWFLLGGLLKKAL